MSEAFFVANCQIPSYCIEIDSHLGAGAGHDEPDMARGEQDEYKIQKGRTGLPVDRTPASAVVQHPTCG